MSGENGPEPSGVRRSDAERLRRRRGQRLEAAMGFLGFFALVTLIAAVRAIVIGEPSVLASGILVVLLALLAWALRQWRRL